MEEKTPMKLPMIIYGERNTQLQKKAIEVLSEFLLDYTYEYQRKKTYHRSLAGADGRRNEGSFYSNCDKTESGLKMDDTILQSNHSHPCKKTP